MNKLEQAARQALEALCVAVEPKRGRYYCMDEQPVDMVVKYTEAITALREALAEPVTEPDYWLGYGLQAYAQKPFEGATPLYAAPVQQAEQEPEYKGWYCAHCERGVDGSEVTFHEQHEVCGRVITNDVPPKPVMQEPVKRFTSDDVKVAFENGYAAAMSVADIAKEVEQEPVAVVEITYGREPECYVTGNIDDFPEGVFKLYAAPQPVKQEPVAIDWEKAHEVLCDVWNRVISADDGFDAIQDLIYAAPVRTKDLTDEEIEAIMVEQGDLRTAAFARAVIAADREKNK